MISVIRILNPPINSNTYLLTDALSMSSIIIDPGSLDANIKIERFVNANKLKIKFVLLTHEHFDHIAGVNDLSEKYHFTLLCSSLTAKALLDARKNLSAFADDIVEPIIINSAPEIVGDEEIIPFGDNSICFISSPGHSPGSMCVITDNYFFSGDTILPNYKTRLNLPGSNREQYRFSIKKISRFLKQGMTIYPGHGESFIYKSGVKTHL